MKRLQVNTNLLVETIEVEQRQTYYLYNTQNSKTIKKLYLCISRYFPRDLAKNNGIIEWFTPLSLFGGK